MNSRPSSASISRKDFSFSTKSIINPGNRSINCVNQLKERIEIIKNNFNRTDTTVDSNDYIMNQEIFDEIVNTIVQIGQNVLLF